MFFEDPDEAKCGRHLIFRLVNTVATLVVEVIAMITYYGAYFGIEDLHYQLYGNHTVNLDSTYGRGHLQEPDVVTVAHWNGVKPWLQHHHLPCTESSCYME